MVWSFAIAILQFAVFLHVAVRSHTRCACVWLRKFLRNKQRIEFLHELAGNVTTKAPCDRDCFDKFDYDYNEPDFCSSLLESGQFTCEDDFCPSSDADLDGGVPCLYAGFCDQTCGYCDNGCSIELTRNCSDAVDNKYGDGTCEALLDNPKYACETHFCPDCKYAGEWAGSI